MKISCGDESLEVRLEGEKAMLGTRRVSFRLQRRSERLEGVEVDGRIFRARTARDGERLLVWCDGRAFELRRAARASPGETGGDLVAPMPGRVQRILVGVGDSIARGQVILVLEAMKMEHAIRAPRDGVVAAIAHKEGDLVNAGARLAEIT